MKSIRQVAACFSRGLTPAAALALLAAPAVQAAYPDLILSDHPAAYYRLEETVESTAADSSGNGLDGYYLGTPVLGQPGIDTNSISLSADGSLSCVQAGYYAQLNPAGPFSVEAWVRPTSMPTGGDYRCPVGNFGGWGNPSGWYIYQTPNTPSTLTFIIQGTPVWISSTYNLFDWYHLVGTYDGTNGAFYVNGQLIGSAAATGYVPNPSNPFSIGQRADGYGYFDGNLDEVAIYTKALTADQVLAHYMLGTNSFRNANIPPSIRRDPVSITSYAGHTAQFTVLADGTLPLNYQWFKNTAPIAGATSTALSFTCGVADDSTIYQVVVTNIYGAATSAPAALTVSTGVLVDAQPTSITRTEGSVAAFQVVAEGALPLSYQWRKGAAAIPGATDQTLWLAGVRLADDGSSYSVHVSNPYTSLDSDPAILNVTARTVFAPTNLYSKVVMLDAPVAYWRLDEASGPTAVDAVGSFDGTYDDNLGQGTLAFGAPGIPRSASDTAVGTSGGARISVPYAIELNSWTAFSVEGWFQPSSTAADGNDYRTAISSMSNPAGAGPTGWLLYQQADNHWSWWPYGGLWASASLTDTADLIVPNQWYYIVLSYDGNLFSLYVNGVLQSSGTYAGFCQNGNVPPLGAGTYSYNYQGSGSGPVNIGWRMDNDFHGFAGTIDEVAFYNKALTPQQVQNHYLASVRLTLTKAGNQYILSWPLGTLQQANPINGAWSDLPTATSPYTNTFTAEPGFFRVKLQ
jgi:Concanavalin A-like lectin/glucanases superfamily